MKKMVFLGSLVVFLPGVKIRGQVFTLAIF